MNIEIEKGKKVYFASDQHLGAPTKKESDVREAKFLRWLDEIAADVDTLFLLGDLFDFWFEYKTVVPKGFVRTMAKLAQLKEQGVSIFFFVGNHDLWMNGYFEEELGIPVYHEPKVFTINGKHFFLGHGDGLGPDDIGFKIMKKVFTNSFFQWMFKWIHPDIGVRFAQNLSTKNKMISGKDDFNFLGEDKEWLILYAKRKLEQRHYDHFVFGHRHLPTTYQLNEKSLYTNLGDWCLFFTYASFDGEQMMLETYNN